MSRYNTQVLSNIRMLCRMQNIDEKVLYERAKLILSIYREVCWSTIDRANDVCDTLICTYGDSLDGALIYLENFAPDEARERFEERIRSLFETKWIIELVDMAMLKIREYPDKGALYCEIISKAYLNRFKYKESEMLEVLNDRRLNAERMEAAFYSGRQATPEPVQPAATESSADDKELLLKLLQNPEMAALLKSLAKTL